MTAIVWHADVWVGLGSMRMSEGVGVGFTVEVVSHFLCWARSPLITSVVQLC